MTTASKIIATASPRQEIYVHLDNALILSGPPGTSIETFLRSAEQEKLIHFRAPLVAAIVDNQLRELSMQPTQDVRVQPVLLDSSDGGRIYRRSLVFLLATAVHELWPDIQVSVKYAVPDGGYYCELSCKDLSNADIEALEAQMRRIVAADDRITKRTVPIEKARELFQQRKDLDKVRLLQYRTNHQLTLYTLRNWDDYYYGYMVPSTGYLRTFALIRVNGGFILQYPRSATPTQLLPITTYNKMSAIFHQTDEWLERLELEDIGRLNELVQTQRIREMILVAEALHEQHIARIATDIAHRHEHGMRLVLIAGPSSSGKTTFSKRLAIQLLAHGLRPFTLEMDNYFVDREKTPLDAEGNYDFEALEALDLPLFNEHLLRLMNGEEVRLPRFNFHSGKREEGTAAHLSERQIIIIEGIHGINPGLVPNIPRMKLFRIYVSALTQLNIDMHNRVPTTDIRLLRRIVRDARTRGYNAADTLARWQSVRRGEKRNIFPYQENADAMFNSALPYELAALRPLAEPLLLQVAPGTYEHIEAKRLLSFMRWVVPFSEEQTAMIPDTSLLREFIGGSILSDYHPGASNHE